MIFFSKRAAPETEPAQEKKENISGEAEADYDTLAALISSEKISSENSKNIATLISCIDKISQTVASVPVRLVERKDGKITILKDDNRVKLLNTDAGDTLSAYDMKAAIVRDYYLKKGGYIYIEKKGNKVRSLRYVKPDNISFMVNDDPIYRDYKILCGSRTYEGYNFIKFLRHTENGYRGKSIVEEQSLLLGVVLNALQFERNLVETGGNKKGFLKSAKKLSQEAINKLRAAWRKLYSNNTENVMILNDGLDFKEASNTSAEMQLNQNKITNNREICKIFGVPPSITEGNASENDKVAFLQYCLAPLLCQLQAEFDRVLLLESEKGRLSFIFDISELTKGDIKTRYEAYSEGIKEGYLQIDEVREKENLEPLGLNILKLGLENVLYSPESGNVFVPNTGQVLGLKDIVNKKAENKSEFIQEGGKLPVR